MKNDPFAIIEKYKDVSDADVPAEMPAGDISEGRIIAVKICSHVLDACLWLAFVDDFTPDAEEPLAVYYADEIEFLKSKTPEQLKEIHAWKLTFGPGARVPQ